MNFKLFLENIQKADIVYWSDDDMDDFVDDPNVAYNQAHEAAKLSGVRILRNKELTIVALIEGVVVGGVWTAVYPTGDGGDGEEVYAYDFDVAVHPKHRNSDTGLRLIEEAIRYYDINITSEYEHTMISVYVINPKLAKYLENKYGFEPQPSVPGSGVKMVKY